MMSVRFIAPAALAAALSLVASAASAEPCTTSEDCPLSYNCEITTTFCTGGFGGSASDVAMGGSPAGMAGATSTGATAAVAGSGGAEGVPCLPYEYRECVPGPCNSDSECSEGWSCDTWQEGYYTDPAEDPAVGGGFVVTGEGSQCTPNWVEPCTVAADCGPGFDCVPDEQCWCEGSGGAGSGGIAGSGGSVIGGGGAMMGGAAPAGTAGIGNVGAVPPGGSTGFAPAGGSTGGTCPPGFVQCGTVCSNVALDADNCGACGVACAAGETCVAGVCSASGMGGSGGVSTGGGGTGGVDCQCRPSGTSSCRAREIHCATGADCPETWSCQDMGAGGGSCVINEDGSTFCEPGVPDYRCTPPDYWGTAGMGGSAGAPVGGTTAGGEGSLGGSGGGSVPTAGVAGGSSGGRTGSTTGGASSGGRGPTAGTTALGGRAGSGDAAPVLAEDDEMVQRGGCQIGPKSSSPSIAGLLLGLALSLGLRRRRR